MVGDGFVWLRPCVVPGWVYVLLAEIDNASLAAAPTRARLKSKESSKSDISQHVDTSAFKLPRRRPANREPLWLEWIVRVSARAFRWGSTDLKGCGGEEDQRRVRVCAPLGFALAGRTNASVATWALLVCRLQRFYQPRDDYFFEDSRVGPHAYLAAQVAAVGIDPCFLRHIAFT